MALDPMALVDPVMLLAAFAGGAFGASIGALPAFIFTGFMVMAGETATYVDPEFAAITGQIGFGPVFGPHISFAGGAAAVAYAARQGYMDTGFAYHEAKNILFAHGTRPDVLAVGGLFGILGYWGTTISGGIGLPWDPIAVMVVLSAVAHRLAFGYPIMGSPKGSGFFDMGPFEREEERADSDRLKVEPWLGHQYKWGWVAMLGLVAGALGAFIALVTGSPFLGFGISAASLFFLNLGVAQFPVTHHITLPASTAALAVLGNDPSLSLVAMIVGTVFGISGALFGEITQRLFYSHSDTHLDPPAFSITINTFFIFVLYVAGVFPTTVWVPTLGM